ncbi:DUF3168 domain-containing protein [Thalassobius sp. Cn5-15]|jgi:hypothetical protein|uniref:DUF3168 domain-containing protein n=1 Tax=Thalassobius sp. Cn5-15 TaxID=2917763 RepID=UPI001EF2D1EB|nr:DUF3168 domain-containing protein [Thalassobius sp. Cn5-15]MCG7492072.1 DUF3168 domain-containing protein [Thalassobius sp. Cn5-15]
MTYALAAALQQAVFDRLSNDADLLTLVDGVYDALPAGTAPDRYVQIGAEKVTPRSDKSGTGARHELQLLIVGQDTGFLPVKLAAVRISDLLQDTPLSLTRGHLLRLWFLSAEARRDRSDNSRQIILRFAAQTYDE